MDHQKLKEDLNEILKLSSEKATEMNDAMTVLNSDAPSFHVILAQQEIRKGLELNNDDEKKTSFINDVESKISEGVPPNTFDEILDINTTDQGVCFKII